MKLKTVVIGLTICFCILVTLRTNYVITSIEQTNRQREQHWQCSTYDRLLSERDSYFMELNELNGYLTFDVMNALYTSNRKEFNNQSEESKSIYLHIVKLNSELSKLRETQNQCGRTTKVDRYVQESDVFSKRSPEQINYWYLYQKDQLKHTQKK